MYSRGRQREERDWRTYERNKFKQTCDLVIHGSLAGLKKEKKNRKEKKKKKKRRRKMTVRQSNEIRQQKQSDAQQQLDRQKH